MSAPAVRKVVLATWFPRDPSAPRGGVEAVSVNLARALAARNDMDIHVVTVSPDTLMPEVTAWNGITIHRLPRGGGPLLRFAAGAGRKMVQDYLLQLHPEVVHAHDTFGIMTQGLALPRVFTIHGFIYEDTRFQGGLKAQLRSWLWKRKEIACWEEQPHIVSISPYVRERLRGIARGVIHDIENPIASECFQVARHVQEGTIFSAAVISERKNTLGLVKAFSLVAARHPHARLRLAGPVVEESYGDSVRRCIAESGLSERVSLLGSISGVEVRRELGKAGVFALVSLEEGAPMGIAESMAAGVPVLTSNRCGMPYMLRHRESGFLVDPNDQQDIARCLDELFSDTALGRKMGQQAQQDALSKFHPSLVAERTLKVYERALDGSPSWRK